MAEPVELTVDECVDLLNGGVFGRVALSTPVGPRIVPVNYAMYGDDIVFRTTPYSELGTYGWNVDAAFEIDEVDYDEQRGWSVVAVGRLTIVDDPDELADIRRNWDPRPWAQGARRLYLKLAWRSLTGRRLSVEWSRSPMSAERHAL